MNNSISINTVAIHTTFAADITFQSKEHFSAALLKPEFSPIICDILSESLKTPKTHTEHWLYLCDRLRTTLKDNANQQDDTVQNIEATVGIYRTEFKRQYNDLFRALRQESADAVLYNDAARAVKAS